VTTIDADLGRLLARAARGDTGAFMRFYDATSRCAFGLALAKARARGLRGGQAEREAMVESEVCYVRAWARSHEHATSGLSPLAWLLSLPALTDEAACA
jgi:hypothetical protein